MSLDVYLYREYHVSYDGGKTLESREECIFHANITHNLNRMAQEVGFYGELWRPAELGIIKAEQLIKPLTKGLEKLKEDPVRFSRFNAPNGWGVYDNLVEFTSNYLEACKEFPKTTVYTSI